MQRNVDAATLVVGAPTIHAGPHPLVVNAAYLPNALRPKVRFASIVGSYGWNTVNSSPQTDEHRSEGASSPRSSRLAQISQILLLPFQDRLQRLLGGAHAADDGIEQQRL